MSSTVTSLLRRSVLGWMAALAAALAFSPLFERKGYLLAAATMTAAPLLVGVALRAARAPEFAVLPAQLLVLVSWVALLWAPDTLRWLVLPTPESVDVLALLTQAGFESAQALPPPVPDEPGILFITAVGITACFVLVDLLGTGLDRVPLTGLPLLALYTVPAAIAPDGVPAWSFVAAAIPYVALLGLRERERLGGWGRQVALAGGVPTESERRRLNTSAVTASAQRIGFAAIAVAAAVPLLLPAFPAGVLREHLAGGGPGGVRVENPIVDLQRELVERSTEPALFVRTDGPTPEYFRLVALDQFDGERWTISERDLDASVPLRRVLGSPPGLTTSVDRRRQRYFVEVSHGFESDWLPAPYAPRSVVGLPGQWRFDLAMFDIVTADGDQTTAGLAYAVEAVIADPSAEQLQEAPVSVPATIGNRYGQLPADVPEQVADTADRVTKGAVTNFEKAVALQRYFTGGRFEYSLTRVDSGHDGDAIVRFLDEKVGYCEQFAATMAIMARLEGIPARVSVGFLRAAPTPDVPRGDLPRREAGGSYEFRYADLHTWPELYFTGIGWVRFEPTPSARAGALPPGYAAADVSPGAERDGGGDPLRERPPAPAPTAPGRPLDPGQQPVAGDTERSGEVTNWWPAGIGLTLTLLLTPALARALVRRRRWAGADDPAAQAEVAWAELRDTLLDLRLAWPTGQTPRGTARMLSRLVHDDGATSALHRIAHAVERARFSRHPVDGGQLRHDVTTVRTALHGLQSRSERLRSTLLPASLRGILRDRSRRRADDLRNRTRGDDASALPAAP
ncbi:MAG: DUF3488 and transglutaminase-like domain-containing protein [Actinomycetota bacterium]|nr:DUF3488 and transglutaminase-like domain-containing protein [Actinomycetota bacterium]